MLFFSTTTPLIGFLSKSNTAGIHTTEITNANIAPDAVAIPSVDTGTTLEMASVPKPTVVVSEVNKIGKKFFSKESCTA